MENIILPQVNILSEINNSTNLMVEHNGKINRYPISDLDIGGGDVTIDLSLDFDAKPNPVDADTLGGIKAEEYATQNFVKDEAVSKSQVVNNFTTTEEGFVADARALKTVYDKFNMDLLWQNGDTSSAFDGSTISDVDVRGYRFIYVVFNSSTTSTGNQIGVLCIVGGKTRLIYSHEPSDGFTFGYRTINATSSAGTVDIGYFIGIRKTSTASFVSENKNNTIAIPVAIYGIV